jgi:S1-C subfamily serine protease
MKTLLKKSTKKALLFGAALLGVTLVSLNAEDWHGAYLDSSVGNVVIKVTQDKTQSRGGSGFHVEAPSGSTYILTNAHVCHAAADDGKVVVSTVKHDRTMKRNIIEIYDKHDLCLVEGLPGVKGIEVANSFEPGQNARVIGFPGLRARRQSLGKNLGITDINLVTDVVQTEEQATACKESGGKLYDAFVFFLCVKQYKAVETNIVGFGGNSGSPAINFWGNLVGVLFAGDSKTNYSFLVPLSDIKAFLQDY